MKRFSIMIILLSVIAEVSAQKITVKTANGQTVEITCDGMIPNEVQIEGDKVTFKMNDGGIAKADTVKAEATAVEAEEADSIDTFVPVGDNMVDNNLTPEESNEFTNSEPSAGSLINSLAEEISPEYAEFNKEHIGYHPSSEKELVEDVAKKVINPDIVETADFLSALFKELRFTKDSTFVPQYEQRKPKKSWRAYDIISLSGNLGKDISKDSEVEDNIDFSKYGDEYSDRSNEKKIGGALEYSRVYIKGTEDNGVWKQNPLGLAWSWGALLNYYYEGDMGSHFSAMGKVGVQIGQDITIGADALLGCGISPYDIFMTNGINYSVVNKSSFCFKYGAQIWGSLNFSRDTYTAIFARYIKSFEPTDFTDDKISDNWGIVFEDFDPSSWSIGFAVGYKFGAPQALSTDKRLQATLSTGYQFSGNQTGFVSSAQIERLTKVSYSTTLNYGLSVDLLFDQQDQNQKYASVLLSGGFSVKQPDNRWFWGSKLYAGIGNYNIEVIQRNDDEELSVFAKKLCAKVALQLDGGFKIGKCSELFASFRAGYHFGKKIANEGLDNVKYQNLNGFELDTRLGYRFTF